MIIVQNFVPITFSLEYFHLFLFNFIEFYVIIQNFYLILCKLKKLDQNLGNFEILIHFQVISQNLRNLNLFSLQFTEFLPKLL